MEFLDEFSLQDGIALLWFLAAWLGYSLYADRDRETGRNLMQLLAGYRLDWMRAMVRRDMRMGDLMGAGNIMRSVTFLASTTIFIIGGLIAVLGVSHKVVETVTELPFAVPTTRAEVDMKLMILVTAFVYGFFKFTWALRQFNYLSIFLGAAPPANSDDKTVDDYAHIGAGLIALAANHLNGGIRAYYFGIAGLSWFLNPILFMLVTAWVVAVLYLREFRSKTRQVLSGQKRIL
ncbi:MAG: DUF599 family protein [Alphaproteobacteria bacterium]